MSVLTVGKRCIVGECLKIDFLPFSCYSCKNNYCDEHFKSHDCPNQIKNTNRTIKCMVCGNPVAIPQGEDPNIRVEQHIRNKCQKTDSINVKQCQFCKQKKSVTTTCKDCRLELCLTHRHPMDHKCVPKKSKSGFNIFDVKRKECPVQ
eukprot:NODE_134_length_16603_cov_0.784052.p15 type:complete len:148 gc:universal NODE_134_length_16603_cov_0.784052:13478-13035(-)